jgi:hypothetical protein
MHKISSRYLFFSFFPALLHCSLLLLVLNTLAQTTKLFHSSSCSLSLLIEREERGAINQSINQIRKVAGGVVVIREKNIKIKITYTSQQTRHKQICVDE